MWQIVRQELCLALPWCAINKAYAPPLATHTKPEAVQPPLPPPPSSRCIQRSRLPKPERGWLHESLVVMQGWTEDDIRALTGVVIYILKAPATNSRTLKGLIYWQINWLCKLVSKKMETKLAIGIFMLAIVASGKFFSTFGCSCINDFRIYIFTLW